MISPTRTPTKRTIRDITNHQLDTPSRTPTKKQKLDDNIQISKPKAVTKLFQPLVAATSIYSRAKALFQRGYNFSNNTGDCLVSRDVEGKYLHEFISYSLKLNVCNNLYISGPPGTGKTEQVKLTMKRIVEPGFKIVNINCMTLNNPENIFHEIARDVFGNLHIGHKKMDSELFFKTLNKEQDELKSIIVVLDELDSLITRDQQVLFELFQASNINNSHNLKIKLIIIGISNTLDLTDKFLPRLIRNNLSPETLQFLPYTADQIKSIIISRLKSLVPASGDTFPIFHPSAIQLCSRKSASISGDLRKAFDICYKSIELVERNLPPFQTYTDFNSSEYPKVMIPHIAKVCTLSFDNNSISNLNLLQKALLCHLFNYQLENIGKGDLSVNSFYDYYRKQKDANNLLGILKIGEFIEIISALESSSCVVINDKSKKNSGAGNVGMGNKIIKLNVSYDDIVKSIEEIGLLKRVLKSCN
ncbi:Cell division control protein 18 [Spathaspora sp. JA1]|nr:Cell division control protein 18 [Spathaspora sp. JA1]